MRPYLLLTLAVPVLGLFALPAQADPDYAALRTQIREAHTEPGYAALSVAADKLQSAIDQYCKAGQQSGAPQAARQAFHRAMDAWQAVQHIRSGPIEDQDGHARLQFWPDKRGITARHLRQFLFTAPSPTLDTDIADMSVAVQGFPALEQLLFTTKPLSRKTLGAEKVDRCSAAHAISLNIAGIARTLHTASQSDSGGIDARTAVSAVFNDLITGLKFVQSVKLKDAVETATPRPHRLENWRSKRSLKNIAINLGSMKALYQLLYASSSVDTETHALALQQFDAALQGVRTMGEDGTAVLAKADGAAHFLALSKSIELIRERIAPTLVDVLKLPLGFNSLDGD